MLFDKKLYMVITKALSRLCIHDTTPKFRTSMYLLMYFYVSGYVPHALVEGMNRMKH